MLAMFDFDDTELMRRVGLDEVPVVAPLTIAIDFDDTFMADPGLWELFIRLARCLGHTVICVTARRGKFLEDRQEVEQALPAGVKAYFSYDTPKRTYMASQGVEVDIWIDDIPEGI